MPGKNTTQKALKSKIRHSPLCGFWEETAVLEPFRSDPTRATIMAQAVEILRETLRRKNGARFIDQSLRDCQKALYPMSDFARAGYLLFRLFIEGKLLPGDDPRDLADRLRKQTTKPKAKAPKTKD